MRPGEWLKERVALLDAFVALNLAFLALDISVAHAVNRFAHPAEWIPFALSAASPAILWPLLLDHWRRRPPGRVAVRLAVGLGAAAIATGLAGAFLHLESQFFETFTLRGLVYTAPFAAPLAYAGLGFLLLLNRMVDARSTEWSRWVVLFALGGFLGNFVLSVCDHAQNGFFNLAEWIPVAASAAASAFLLLPVIRDESTAYVRLCLKILAVQAAVGVAGFGFHAAGNLAATGPVLDRFLYGAPLFAPLLFPNLALLAAFGLADLEAKLSQTRAQRRSLAAISQAA